ncbi:alkylhydroperoxidase, partial [Pseudomonas sp. MPR-R5A]
HGFNALNAFEGAEEDELYKRSNGKRMNELKNTAPEAVNAFFGFDEQAMKAGLLSKKEKELIAVAVAHITGCAYCIDIHT